MEEEIILYSTNCPKCLVLEKKLIQKRILFIKNDNLSALEERGFMEVPQLEISKECYLNFPAAINWVNVQKG